MEFLDKLVIPFTGGHPGLNYLLLAIASVILLAYSGLLFSSIALSLYYSLKRFKSNQSFHLLAAEYADMGTKSLMAPFGMGILTYLGVILLYALSLHNANSPLTAYLALGFIFYIAALALIMAYKHSLHLTNIFSFVENENDALKLKLSANEEYMRYSKSSGAVRAKSGIWGWVLLTLSIIILIAAQSYAVMNYDWKAPAGILSMLATLKFWAGLFAFLTGSLSLTSGFYLFNLFKDYRDKEITLSGYYDYARVSNAWIAIVSTLLFIIFSAFSYMFTPANALSPALFGIILFVIILAFIYINFAYLIIRDHDIKYAKFTLVAAILIFAASIVKENVSFGISNKKVAAENFFVYEQKKAELIAASGIVEKIDGEAIYKQKCTACHAYDRKLVGPAHKDVLPKYKGNVEALAAFILNPKKVDPAFTQMPPQGLKPNEAKAVAEYMINKLSK